LIQTGRIHPEKLITHKFHGLENVEPALMLMKDKPTDLIKPLVLLVMPVEKNMNGRRKLTPAIRV